MKIPIVTIVGRPNVGKSTLFNKIVGSRVAITAEEAGTTRDRLFHRVRHPLMDFFLVDTGGLEFGKGETTIEDDMQAQSRIAIEEADLILFVVENGTELLPQDFSAADILRSKSMKKPVFLLVNKCDHPLNHAEMASFYSLGLGDPYQISAMHKTGIGTLVDRLVAKLRDRDFLTKKAPEYKKLIEAEGEKPSVALVGKPNVGKSSLINALLNKNQLIVSEIPGTTRDSTDSIVRHDGREFIFIDTAGLRRVGKTERGIEKFSALRSMVAIERCDVALLVLDSSEEISHQDQKIAQYILDSGRGLIIMANKWDIKGEDEEDEKKRRDEYTLSLRRKFAFLSWAPVIFTSAVTKKNLSFVFDQIDAVMAERRKRIPTGQLNVFVEQAVAEHRPTGAGRLHPKIYYITQPETEPPHFIIFVNKKSAFHFSYLRFLENRLREKFAFTGTPLKLEYKEKERRSKD